MDWFWPQDKLSCHVGINYRMMLIEKQGLVPVKIKLCKKYTELFMREEGWSYIKRGPHFYGPKNHPIQIEFNCLNMYGIIIEASPRPVREYKLHKHACSEGEIV